MKINVIVSATAIAMVVGLGTASAADRFTTLADVEALAMSPQMMDEVRGGDHLGIEIEIEGPGVALTERWHLLARSDKAHGGLMTANGNLGDLVELGGGSSSFFEVNVEFELFDN